ncbi:VWD domain-containing protein [Plantactinospora sp. WMMC1484]|uniref:VWD domain-containing protein n=1 Tax=Plantactinospora sp. WMMC1484 TaxID=3404122 RepID=UPI003BF470CF
MGRFTTAVKGLALAGVIVLLAASPALAVIVVDPAVQAAYAGCVGQMRGSGTDDILKELEQSGKKIRIRHPILDKESSTTTYLPGSDVQINWVPGNDGRKFPSEGGPEFTEDQCATLAHEMAHAADFANGVDRGQFCLASDGTPASPADPAEVHAVVAENAYRQAVGLPLRTSYSGYELPSDGKDCAPPRPDRPRGGCSVSAVGANYRCASSNGDPHLTTFDGLRYDFQAAGEFVLARSAGGDLEVQVRQTMFPGSTVASVNSAVVANVAGDRVGVHTGPDGPSLRVNGAGRPAVPGSSRLPKGGTLAVDPEGTILVTWPDRSVLHVVPIGPWGLSIDVGVPSARSATMTGLLGDHDGDPADDLVVHGGGPLAQPPPFSALYPGYADSWRIAPDRSLFDYEPGQDTATFIDRRFPTKPITVADLPNRSTAELLCRQAGVTDPRTLDDCVLDVGLTGQPAFALDAARAQRHNGAAARQPGPTSPGGTLRDGGVVRDSISAAGEVDTFRLETGDATVLRLLDVTGDPGRSGAASLRITLHGPDASGSPGFTVTSTHQFRVRPGASYTLTVDRTNGDTGDYGFRLVTAKERRIPTTLGKVTGSLDVPGRVVLHAFEATRQGRLRLTETSGCDFTVGVVEDSPTPHVYTPANLCWDIDLVTLRPGKRYLLVVWSDRAATGNYSFRTTVAD